MAAPGALSRRPAARRMVPSIPGPFLLAAVLQLRVVGAVTTLISDLMQPQGLAIDVKAKKMYWTEVSARTMSRADLNGSNVEVLVGPSEHTEDAPFGIALDTRAGKVYWTSQCCTIRRANLDGSDEEHVVNATYAGAIALDADAGKMYWTSWLEGSIWRADLDGSDPEVLLSNGLKMPIDIALDPVRQKVYWADFGKKTVERASLADGSGVEVLNVSWAIMQTNGIALDLQSERIYLTASATDPGGRFGSIYRATLSGAESEVMVGQLGMDVPYGIAYQHHLDAIFWTDQKAGTIQRLYLRCLPGRLSVDTRENKTDSKVIYGTMNHGGLQSVICPRHYSGELRLMCYDGTVSVSSGECFRDCDAGTVNGANNSKLVHGPFRNGEMITADCGEGLIGPVHMRCDDGDAAVVSGHCRAPRNCPAAHMALPESAQVRHGLIEHGGSANVSCPEGFNGSYELGCRDGTIHTISGVCQASCDEGSVWVDDGGDMIEVPHGPIRPGHSLRVVCPDGSAGQGVKLECMGDFIRILQSQCIRSSRCHAGSLLSGTAELTHGPMSDGDVFSASCPEDFDGVVNLTCDTGHVSIYHGMCTPRCSAGTFEDNNSVEIPYEASSHGDVQLAVCPEGFTGVVPLACHNGNITVQCASEDTERCSCQRVVPKGSVNVPVGTMGPVVGCFIFLALAVFLFRRAHACRKQRAAMAAPIAVPAAAAKCLVEALGLGAARSPGARAQSITDDLESQSAENSNEVFEDVTVPLPSYWATRSGIHILPDSNRINEMQRLMTDTWRVCYTRDRGLVAGGHRMPTGCRVAQVARIENHVGFERYWKHKAEIIAKRKRSSVPFATTTDRRLNLLDDECNEKYLFHGTNPEAAHAIARELFSINLAGSSRGCMFGPGIYLAENASKSDEYAKEGSGIYVGLSAMIVCRAVTGNVLNVTESGDFSERILNGEFDSLCGDRLAAAGTFRENVFFHEQAVYPEFIVIYARNYGDD